MLRILNGWLYIWNCAKLHGLVMKGKKCEVRFDNISGYPIAYISDASVPNFFWFMLTIGGPNGKT